MRNPTVAMLVTMTMAACGGVPAPEPTPDAAELGVPAFEACTAYGGAAATPVRLCGGDVDAHRTRWTALCATTNTAVTIAQGEFAACVDPQRGALWRVQPCVGAEVAWQADARACLETFGGP